MKKRNNVDWDELKDGDIEVNEKFNLLLMSICILPVSIHSWYFHSGGTTANQPAFYRYQQSCNRCI